MAGNRTIHYNGRNISVPADATDAEVAQILDASDGTSKPAAPAQQPGLLQRVWNWATSPTIDASKMGQKPDVQRAPVPHPPEHSKALDEFMSGMSSPAAIASNIIPIAGPEASLAARVGTRVPGAVLAGSNIASGVSDMTDGHVARGVAQAGVGLLGAHGATEGLGREVRPLVGKVARVASDVVDPELTGVFSPRLGNAQRLMGRLADKIEKEARPAAKEAAPIRQGPRKPVWANVPNEARPDPVAQIDQTADEASINKLLGRKAAIEDAKRAKPARVPLWKQIQEPEGTPPPEEPESNIERARRRAPAPLPRSVGASAAGFGEENPRVMSSARAEHEYDQSLLAKLRDDLDAHGESAATGVSKMGWMGNKAGYDPVLPLGPNAPAGYQTMHGPVNLEGVPIDINTGEMPNVGGGSMMDPEAARNIHLGKLRPGPMFGKPLSVVNPDFVPGGDAVPNPRSRLGNRGNGVLEEPYHPFRYEDVPLSNIRQTDGDFDPVLGADYAERWANEGPPPPIATVVESRGENPDHFLQQGHHRTTAAGMLGLPSILSRAEYPPPFDEGVKGVSMPWDWRDMATPEELEQVDRLDRLDSGSNYGTPYDSSSSSESSSFSMKRGSNGLLKRVKGST